MPQISATIITLNEEKNIARAIHSLSAADEIVVVDSGSTDATVEIARRTGARVVHHKWEGFSAQKNFAAREAHFDWILSLDADEELSLDAQSVIREWKTAEPEATGYRLARRAQYLGRWILHSGWYPDYKLRLYDRRNGEWRGAFVHESLVVSGEIATLRGEILHYSYESFEDHQKRIESYTDLAAREMFERGQHPGIAARIFVPPWTFFQTYFLRLGILDGYPGWVIARMAARYVRRKYAKCAVLDAARRGAKS